MTPPLSALGIAAVGVGVAWLAVVLGVPVPAALVVWVGGVVAVACAGAGALGAVRRQSGRRRTAASTLLALAALALVPGCLMLPAASGYVASTFRLATFAGPLHRHHPPPPGTRVIAEGAEVGVLTGNGDHCDYIATVVLGANGSVARADVERYDSRLRLRSAVAGGDPEQVRLEVLAGRREPNVFGDSAPRYVVRFIDVHGPNADVRCW